MIPSLIAWGAVAFLPAKAALAWTAAGFIGLLLYNLAVVRAGGAPPWYRTLRLDLTTVVMLSLALVVLASA